jgi:hypothetical protein
VKTAAVAALVTGILLLTVACGGGGSSSGSSASSSSSGSSGSSGGSGVSGTGGTLSISTTSLPDGLTGKSYSASIAVSGGNGRLTWSISSGSFFPAGLSLDADTGSITGTVSNAVFGDVTFQVADSSSPQQVAMKTIGMTFRWALSITSNPNPMPGGHTGVPYQASFSADAANGNVTWSLASGQVPPGLSLTNLTSSEADLVGTPTQTGTYAFTVQTIDSSTPPQTATSNASITVDNKLAVLTVQLPAAYANEPYSQTVSAANGTLPYHWSFGTYRPAGLSIDANTGLISGTPGQGNYELDVVVTDSSSPAQTAQQSYSMLILPRLHIVSSALPDARLSQSYNFYVPYTGGTGNLAWSVVSGSLPPGLSLQPQYGTVSGTPAQLGAYSFTVQVQDSSTPPQIAQGQMTVNVRAATLTLQSSLPQRIPVNVAFDGFAAVSGGTAPFTWTLNAGPLPPGLNLDTSTGEISGTPTANGAYAFTLNASDSSSPPQLAQYTYTITVGPALGRNDTVSHATTLTNGSFVASVSPLFDPPTATSLSADTDYYRITAVGGAIVKANVYAVSSGANPAPLDPVLEFVDANGVRLNACRLPGDTTTDFNSSCLDDDISPGVDLNSQLEYLVPGTADTKADAFAHVFDWRGDARPDMIYSISVSGAFVPIVFATPAALPDFAANTYINFSISANGGTGMLNGSIASGQLPPGLVLQNLSASAGAWTGIITGSATTAGDYSFTLQVSDQASPQQVVSQQFTWHVFPALQLTAAPPQTLTAGQTTTYQATATGGMLPYYWSVYGWSGVTIDGSTGLMTFHPSVAGQFSYQLWVNGSGTIDGGTQWSNQTYTITVNP